MLKRIELVRNPKVGTGWVYNITDGKWMKAINPHWVKGTIVEADFLFEENKYYLVKYDDSSWKNIREYYEILKVENDELKKVASFSRYNGNYEFEDEKIKQLFIEFSTLKLEEQNDNEFGSVKINVIELAKFIVQKIQNQ